MRMHGSRGNTVMSEMRSDEGWQGADSPSRRRSRQAVPRPRTVRFALTDQEFAELGAAAARAGLAKGAYQAEAKLNATGQRSGDLLPYAAEAARRAERLDAVAEQVRKRLRR